MRDNSIKMSRNVISTPNAPAAIGPYSQAISLDQKMVYTSGQIPLTKDGTLIKGTIQEQTQQALTNLGEVLKASGSDFNHVVKTTVFLSDMGLFQEMNQVYATFFPENPPARSTIAAKGLPMGVDVEIEAVALVKV